MITTRTSRNAVSPGFDAGGESQPVSVGRRSLTAQLSRKANLSAAQPVSVEAPAPEARPGEFQSVFGDLIQRESDGNGVRPDAAAAVSAASGSPGSALPIQLQRKFESSLGADLSGVRVHTGGASAAAASEVSAHAYTIGQDVHFGAGQYSPESPLGEKLLAHEVAHTVQQRGAATGAQFKLEVLTPGDSHEVEADRAADAMVTGAPAQVTTAAGVSRKVMRKENNPGTFGLAGGYAAGLDIAGQQGGLAASGADGMLKVITSDTTYATKQSESMTERATAFAKMDSYQLPDTGGTPPKDTKWYADLVKEAGQYVADVQRVELAGEAYNSFVQPANTGVMAAKQLRVVAANSGIKDDLADKSVGVDANSAGTGMSAEQKKALTDVTSNTHKEMLSSAGGKEEFNGDLDALTGKVDGARKKSDTARTAVLTGTIDKRKLLVDRQVTLQASLKEASEADKQKILDEIKAISDAATHAAEIAVCVTGMVSGPAGLADASFDKGVSAASNYVSVEKKELTAPVGDLATHSTKDVATGGLTSSLKPKYDSLPGLAGSLAGGIAEFAYDDKLKELDAKIKSAQSSMDALKKFGQELSELSNATGLANLVKTLKEAMGDLSEALKRRREFIAELTKKADAKLNAGKTGKNKNDDGVSQMGVLLSDALDAKTTLESGKTAGATSRVTVAAMSEGVNGHRRTELAVPRPIAGGMYGARYVIDEKAEPAGADGTQLAQMTQSIDGWDKLADKNIAFADKVKQGVTNPTDG